MPRKNRRLVGPTVRAKVRCPLCGSSHHHPRRPEPAVTDHDVILVRYGGARSIETVRSYSYASDLQEIRELRLMWLERIARVFRELREDVTDLEVLASPVGDVSVGRRSAEGSDIELPIARFVPTVLDFPPEVNS